MHETQVTPHLPWGSSVVPRASGLQTTTPCLVCRWPWLISCCHSSFAVRLSLWLMSVAWASKIQTFEPGSFQLSSFPASMLHMRMQHISIYRNPTLVGSYSGSSYQVPTGKLGSKCSKPLHLLSKAKNANKSSSCFHIISCVARKYWRGNFCVSAFSASMLAVWTQHVCYSPTLPLRALRLFLPPYPHASLGQSAQSLCVLLSEKKLN